jgi:pantoate--beta-alanine ligase
MRSHVAGARARGRSVALVPTMGAFHAGHESLMRAAREAAGEVVVSLFVNPRQFDEAADLAGYPRSEAADAATAAAAGVDVLYAPPVEAVYPDGFATTVAVAGLGDVLEGARRGAAHFAGVCTVVTKLLNVVTPDVAFFGQKDAQQVAVLRRMVRDLDLPVRLEVLPTIREADGLAMSSRNRRLSAAERGLALGLPRGLDAAARAVASGERDAGALAAAVTAVMRDHGLDPEYVAVVDPDTLEPRGRLDGPALVAVAARAGATRLIDNVVLEPVTSLARSS